MICVARLFGPRLASLSGHYTLQFAPLDRHDSIPALAADILENAPSRFSFAGLSMGGIVALEVYSQALE